MNSSLRFSIPGAALVTALSLSGCINASSTVKVDQPRRQVSFENETAGRLFYETLSHVQTSRPAGENKTSVSLLLVNVERREVTGPNSLFNEAIDVCDSDHNGTITLTEATIYRNAFGPR
ncbi:MAG: hypothetical protein JNN01_12180 [Opitutaceae bacterium]|nr:hypothetical protein [Opitutaceae bacterium]